MKPDSSSLERDLRLIEAAKSGKQFAFEALLKHYYKAVYHLIYKIVRQEEDAEDLTYISFTKAFNHLEKYQPTHSFITWLFRIASNTAIDFLRKKRLKTVGLTEEYDDENNTIFSDHHFQSSEANPEEKIIRKQRKDYMQRMVEQLDEDLKAVITLRFFKEYSYEEIAQELTLPLGTVKTYIYRAKKKLYKLIEKDNSTP